MRSFKFASTPQGEKDIEVAWDRVEKVWKYFVTFRGQQVGEYGMDELSGGKFIALPDGQELYLIYKKNPLSGFVVDAALNRVPVEEAPGSVKRQLAGVAGFVFFIAGVNIILGLIQFITKNDFLFNMGLNIYSVALGAIWAVLGIFILRKSMAALVISLVLYILMTITNMFFAIQNGASPSYMNLAVPVIITIYMIQAIKVLKDSRKPQFEQKNN